MNIENFEWQGGIEDMLEGKNGHVKARFLINPERDQHMLMKKLADEYFCKTDLIQIDKYEPMDIYANLAITKKYRDLVYVRFDPTSFEDKRFFFKQYLTNTKVYLL
jgi:hypothetical protein